VIAAASMSGLSAERRRPKRKAHTVRTGIFVSALISLALGGRGHGQDFKAASDALPQNIASMQRKLDALESRLGSVETWPAESSRIRLLFPEMTETDVDTLLDAERTLTPFQAAPASASYQRALSSSMSKVHVVSNEGPFNRYFSASNIEVRIDPALTAPTLKVDQTDPLHPQVHMLVGHQQDDMSFYFEFDTAPEFNSPNFWRQPALVPQTFPADLTGRAGLGYNIFLSHVRDIVNAKDVKFPFRVTAMSLPLAWGTIDFSQLALLAQLVGHGLKEEQIISEVFQINRQRVLYSHETTKRAPIDTFKSGLGECIHANELTGTMLELNGIRFRTVGGFNPTIRNIYPGAGHASIEVLRSNGQWEYLDPYLDAYEPGTNAENFRDRPLGRTVIYEVDRKRFRSPQLPAKVTLTDLFKYRIYSDSALRLPSATMLQLMGGEQQYGSDWPLRSVEDSERLDLARDLPRQFTVYVRGRYILSKCKVAHDVSCGDPEARASPWAEASFVVEPVDLLTHSSSPSPN